MHWSRAYTLGGWFTFVAIAIGGSALLGAGVSIYEGDKAQSAAENALNQEQQLAAGLTYQPINISQLQSQATAASIANATASLNLQKQLQPQVYAANQALQDQVAAGIKAGGALTPDEQSQVATSARIAGGASGGVGGVGPYTAALTGQSANALLNQRENQGEALAAANPAPPVGLSASDLASATIANSNAANQFNLAKAGIQGNLINSGAQVAAGAAGAQGGAISSALSGITGAAALSKLLGTSTPSNSPGVTTGSVNSGTFAPVSGNFSIDTGLVPATAASGYGGLAA